LEPVFRQRPSTFKIVGKNHAWDGYNRKGSEKKSKEEIQQEIKLLGGGGFEVVQGVPKGFGLVRLKGKTSSENLTKKGGVCE